MTERTPEEWAAIDEAECGRLRVQGAALRLDGMDKARAFVEHMGERDAERLARACAERGRPESVALRIAEACRSRGGLRKLILAALGTGDG